MEEVKNTTSMKRRNSETRGTDPDAKMTMQTREHARERLYKASSRTLPILPKYSASESGFWSNEQHAKHETMVVDII
jgi:hypothetical protein